MRATIVLAFLMTVSAWAAEPSNKINFSFKNADLDQVIEAYAKASGQKFIIDPNAKGKITIINNEPVAIDTAFNQMSSALAINNLGISKQDDMMVIMQARNLQRNLIDVVTEVPPLKPEKMYTWVINLKYISAEEVNQQIRILTSRDGELLPFTHGNQLIVSDWSSNLHRVAQIIKDIDVPANPNAMATVATSKKARKAAAPPVAGATATH